MSKLSKPLVATGVAVLVAVLYLALPAAAQEEDNEHGWTVWQNNQKMTFRFKDHWKGSPVPSGFVMRNTKSSVEINFYGTFRVEFRPRDQ